MSLKVCRECGELVSDEARICPKCGIKNPVKQKLKAKRSGLIWIALVVIIALFVLDKENGTVPRQEPSPENQEAANLEHAAEQFAEAMKDPDKVRLMECIGADPWKESPKPAGWTPPTKEECFAVARRLGTAAGASEEAIASTLKVIATSTMPDAPDSTTTSEIVFNKVYDAPGSVWQKVQTGDVVIYVQTKGGSYSETEFHTRIVADLPESDIVGSPLSTMTEIRGSCTAMTYQVWGVLSFEGKRHSGFPVDSTMPENFIRKVVPDSPMEAVFNLLCKKVP